MSDAIKPVARRFQTHSVGGVPVYHYTDYQKHHEWDRKNLLYTADALAQAREEGRKDKEMTDKDIDKIPITVEVPKADVWVRADYRDIVRRLGEVHMIRACEHQHDDDFVPLYDLQTVAGYQVEAERLRERNKRQAKRLWYVEHLLRSAYPYVPPDTAWDFNCGGYLQDLIDQALGDDDAK